MEGLVSVIMCQSWCKVDTGRGGDDIQICTHKLQNKFLTSQDEYTFNHTNIWVAECWKRWYSELGPSPSYLTYIYLTSYSWWMRPGLPLLFVLICLVFTVGTWASSHESQFVHPLSQSLQTHNGHTSCDLWPWYKQCRIHTGSPLHSSPVVVSLPDEVALLLSHMQDICSAWSVENSLLLFAGHGWHMPNVR